MLAAALPLVGLSADGVLEPGPAGVERGAGDRAKLPTGGSFLNEEELAPGRGSASEISIASLLPTMPSSSSSSATVKGRVLRHSLVSSSKAAMTSSFCSKSISLMCTAVLAVPLVRLMHPNFFLGLVVAKTEDQKLWPLLK